MGCFSITAQKARKKMVDRSQVPEPQSLSRIYENKPALLPHPYEVEQGAYTRTLSAPSMITDKDTSLGLVSRDMYKKSRALSVAGRIRQFDSYAHSSSPRADMQSPFSPLSRSILPFSDPALSQSIDQKKAFGGRPLPLPIPHSAATGHPLPNIPNGRDHSSSALDIYSPDYSSGQLPFCSSRCSTPSREGNPRSFEIIRVSISSQPRPLPQPPTETNTITSFPRVFMLSELATACQNFSSDCCIGDTGAALLYRCWICNVSNSKKNMEVAVMKINSMAVPQDSDSLRDFTMEATKLSCMRHPHLCQLIGFCTEDTPQPGDSEKSKARLVVYEYLCNGSADKLLYGREDGAPLNWSTRVKIALGAAEGLAYLHTHSFRQIFYRDFSTFNILIDKDFNAKLTGYGFVRTFPCELLPVTAYTAPETAGSGTISHKSNVWSFGVMLLELLTGRQNLDIVFPEEEQDLVKWSKSFAADDTRLFLGMDPELKGCYPAADVKVVVNLALKCLNEEPALRPSMKEVIAALASCTF